MGIASVDDVIVPLVINRAAGVDFRISIDTFGLSAGTNVYLEDNQNDTMTLLNEQDFELTPANNLSGAGRFFIHFIEANLSIEDEVTSNFLNVYKLNAHNFITIEGLVNQSSQTNLRLYDFLGKELISKTFLNNINTQTISTQGLTSGIYVIKLESENNVITKKLFIK
jgi:hypothetical protein